MKITDLSEEIKNEIKNKLKNGYLVKDIMQEYKISKHLYYKVINENNDKKSVISFKSDTKSDKISDKSSEKSLESDTEVENENNETKESIKEEKKEEEIIYIEQKNDFDKEKFIHQLNNSINSSKSEIKQEIIQENKDLDSQSDNEITKPQIKKPFKNILSNNNSYVKRNKSNIIDTLQNCNNIGNIDELKEKRSSIIIIRQYINTFPEQLKNIYQNKSLFEKKIFTMNLDQLNVILEDIRITLNLSKNKQTFNNIVQFGLNGFENISKIAGYNIDGLTEELMKNPDFRLDLDIISCEIDMSKYINPKTSAFIQVVKQAIIQNKKYEIKSKLDNLFNDPSKIDLLKNLKK